MCLRRKSDDGLTTQFDGRIEAFKAYRTQVHKIIWINVTLLLTQWVINVALEPHLKTKLCRPQWKSRQASRINRTSLSFSIENTGTTFFICLHQKFALMLNYVVRTQMVVGRLHDADDDFDGHDMTFHECLSNHNRHLCVTKAWSLIVSGSISPL